MVQAYAYDILNQKQAPFEDHDGALAPVERATQRLALALDRLELGVQRLAGGRSEAPEAVERIGRLQRENEQLLQERETLDRAVAQLRDQYGELQLVASMIHERLDASVKSISGLID